MSEAQAAQMIELLQQLNASVELLLSSTWTAKIGTETYLARRTANESVEMERAMYILTRQPDAPRSTVRG